MVRAVSPSRPNAPDPALLSNAIGQAGRFLGWDSDRPIESRVGSRIERSRSTVFRIELSGAPTPDTELYYKVSHSPVDGSQRRERWEAAMAEGLSRAPVLDQRLAEATTGLPITFARTLAVDPPTLTLVTLGVTGTPVGRVSRHLFTRRRRDALLVAFAIAGRAARLIEECSPAEVEADRSVFRRAIERRVERARTVLSESLVQALERRMSDLDDEVLSDPGALVYSHGDFSSSNVMLRPDGIGLIDFTWPPRLRGFDVAHFAFRVEYETAALSGWTGALVKALLDGYDDPGLVNGSRWWAIRIPRLLKIIELGAGAELNRHRRTYQRATKELETLVESRA